MNRRGKGLVSGATGLPLTRTSSPSSTGVVGKRHRAVDADTALGDHALGFAAAADPGLLQIDIETHDVRISRR